MRIVKKKMNLQNQSLLNKIFRTNKRVTKKSLQKLIKIENKKEQLDNKKTEKIKNGLPVFKGFFWNKN